MFLINFVRVFPWVIYVCICEMLRPLFTQVNYESSRDGKKLRSGYQKALIHNKVDDINEKQWGFKMIHQKKPLSLRFFTKDERK